MRKTVAATAMLALVLAAPLWAQSEAPARISVKGTMVTQVPPDTIVWSVSITSRSAVLKEAKTASDTATDRVLGVVKSLDTAAADVQTGQLNVNREYAHDSCGNQTPKGWSVSRSITLKQHDLARFDDVFTKLVDAADVEVSFRFESSKYHEMRRETRLKAAEIARQKAQALADALGVALGPPLSVEEDGAPPALGMAAGGNLWYASNSLSNGSIPLAAPAAEDAMSGTLAPGMTEIRETVSVTFKIQ